MITEQEYEQIRDFVEKYDRLGGVWFCVKMVGLIRAITRTLDEWTEIRHLILPRLRPALASLRFIAIPVMREQWYVPKENVPKLEHWLSRVSAMFGSIRNFLTRPEVMRRINQRRKELIEKEVVEWLPSAEDLVSSLDCSFFVHGGPSIAPPEHTELMPYWIDFVRYMRTRFLDYHRKKLTELAKMLNRTLDMPLRKRSLKGRKKVIWRRIHNVEVFNPFGFDKPLVDVLFQIASMVTEPGYGQLYPVGELHSYIEALKAEPRTTRATEKLITELSMLLTKLKGEMV